MPCNIEPNCNPSQPWRGLKKEITEKLKTEQINFNPDLNQDVEKEESKNQGIVQSCPFPKNILNKDKRGEQEKQHHNQQQFRDNQCQSHGHL